MASYPQRRGAQHAQPKKSNAALWFGFVAMAILAGGALLATLKKSEAAKQAEAEAQRAQDEAAAKPFADLPPEKPPAGTGANVDPNRPFASLDQAALAETGVPDVGAAWDAAVKLAAEGEVLFQEALTAKGKGETTLLNEKGAQAREKFDAALEMTALLEENLVSKRGESDKLVREIQRTRSTWFDRLRWLHKSTGR